MTTRTRMQRTKGYDPEPMEVPPLFRSPSRPMVMLRWLVRDFFWPQTMLWVVIGIGVHRWATPALERFASLHVLDVAVLWLRNAALMMVVIGGQHWWLYRRRSQGTEFKYDRRWLATNRRSFLFNDQTRDNMFFTLVSGGLVAAGYEAVLLNRYAVGAMPELGAAWAVAVMVFAVFWLDSLHFYAVHRLLHIDPLYHWFHALHHRNVNTGPWSGISMHPVEHLLYLSFPLVFLVLPGSPFLVTFSIVYLLLAPSPSHSGFDRFRINEEVTAPGGDYFHNLHHRYFEVNYGTSLVPLDAWLGTYHDGSVEAHERMKQRRRSSKEA